MNEMVNLRLVTTVCCFAIVGVWHDAVAQSVPVLARAQQVSQHGVTWKFDREVPVGQFVNGDYYVVGPVKVVEIDPAPVDGTHPEPVTRAVDRAAEAVVTGCRRRRVLIGALQKSDVIDALVSWRAAEVTVIPVPAGVADIVGGCAGRIGAVQAPASQQIRFIGDLPVHVGLELDRVQCAVPDAHLVDQTIERSVSRMRTEVNAAPIAKCWMLSYLGSAPPVLSFPVSWPSR